MSRCRLKIFASLAAGGAVLLVACNGKTVSLGTGTTPSEVVSPSAVNGGLTACAQNAAHPNVCCTAGPNEPATCVVYPDAPFTPCAAGATTYPDPRSCCPLDGSGPCEAAPGSPSGGPSAGGPSGGGPSGVGQSGGGSSGGGGCTSVCAPGWYEVSPAPVSPMCCPSGDDGGTPCIVSSTASAGPCSCPSCGGQQPCPPCSCPPSTGTSCAACPPGWQVPAGDPDQCCMTDGSGAIECFSQAVAPEPQAGGSGPSGPSGFSCSGTGGTDGGLGLCSCQENAGGHAYSINCDPDTSTCTCTLDGAATSSFPYDKAVCIAAVTTGGTTALFAACAWSGN
jgi:hypothetical protein